MLFLLNAKMLPLSSYKNYSSLPLLHAETPPSLWLRRWGPQVMRDDAFQFRIKIEDKISALVRINGTSTRKCPLALFFNLFNSIHSSAIWFCWECCPSWLLVIFFSKAEVASFFLFNDSRNAAFVLENAAFVLKSFSSMVFRSVAPSFLLLSKSFRKLLILSSMLFTEVLWDFATPWSSEWILLLK